MFVVDICNVCMLKIRTSPAVKSVVFHFDPYLVKSDGSIVSQPVPFSLRKFQLNKNAYYMHIVYES